MRIQVIKIDFLRVEIGFFTSRKKLIKCAESKGVTDITEIAANSEVNGLSALSTGEDGGTYFFMGVFNGNISTLCHECVHIVDWILSNKGIPISAENSEVRAYLTDYVFGSALQLAKFTEDAQR